MAIIRNIIETTFQTKGAQKAAKATEAVGRQQTRLGQSSASAGRQFSAQANGLGGLVSVYAGAAANIFAITQAFAALSRAAQAEQTIRGLDALAASVGQTSKEVIGAINDITAGQLSMSEVAQQANLALSAGLGDTFKGLTEVANAASRALGRNLTDAFQRIVRGAAKLEPELLDELGIFVRIEPAAAKYAATLNKTASQLTNFEKRQAFANAIVEEGNQKFRDIDTFTDNASTSLERLQARFADLALGVGSFLADQLIPIADFFSAELGNRVVLGVGIAAIVFGKLSSMIKGFVTVTLAGMATSLVNKFTAVSASVKMTTQDVKGLGKAATDSLKGAGGFGGFKGARGEGALVREFSRKGQAGTLSLTDAQRGQALERNLRKSNQQKLVSLRQERKLLDRNSEAYRTNQIAISDTMKQQKGLAASQKVFNARVQQGTGFQRAFGKASIFAAGGVRILGVALAGFMKVTAILAAVVGTLQLIGSLFGKDFIGSAIKWFQSLNQEQNNLEAGVTSLTAAFTKQSSALGQNKTALKEANAEILDTIQNLTKVQGQAASMDGKELLSPSVAFRARLSEVRGGRQMETQAPGKVESARIAAFTKEIDRLREKFKEGGKEALKAAVQIQTLQKWVSVLSRGGIGAVNAFAQFQAMTGVTSAKLSDLVQKGGPAGKVVKGIGDNARVAMLKIGDLSLALTDTAGNMLKVGSISAAQITTLTAEIGRANEDFGRGAVNAEGAAKTLAALTTRQTNAYKSLRTEIMTTTKAGVEDVKRLRVQMAMVSALDDQIESYKKLADQLSILESQTKLIRKEMQSGITALSGAVLKGTVGADGKVATTQAKQAENRFKALKGILALNVKTLDNARKEEEKRKNILQGYEKETKQLMINRTAMLDLGAIGVDVAKDLTANTAALAEEEKKRDKALKNVENQSALVLEREKQIGIIVLGTLGSMEKQIQAAEKLDLALQQQLKKLKQQANILKEKTNLKALQDEIALNNANAAIVKKRENDSITFTNLIIDRQKEITKQAKAQADQNIRKLEVEKESLKIQRRIADATFKKAAAEAKGESAAALGGLERSRAGMVAESLSANGELFINLEAVLKKDKELSEKKAEIATAEIARREILVKETAKRAKEDVALQNKILQNKKEALQIEKAMVQSSQALEDVSIKKRRSLEDLKITTDEKNFKVRSKQMMLEFDIAQLENNLAKTARDDALKIQKLKWDAIKAEFDFGVKLLNERKLLIKAEAKNIANQARALGREKLAGRIEADPLKFGEGLGNQMSGITARINESFKSVRGQSQALFVAQQSFNSEVLNGKYWILEAEKDLTKETKRGLKDIRRTEDNNLALSRKGRLDELDASIKLLEAQQKNNKEKTNAIKKESEAKLEALKNERAEITKTATLEKDTRQRQIINFARATAATVAEELKQQKQKTAELTLQRDILEQQLLINEQQRENAEASAADARAAKIDNARLGILQATKNLKDAELATMEKVVTQAKALKELEQERIRNQAKWLEGAKAAAAATAQGGRERNIRGLQEELTDMQAFPGLNRLETIRQKQEEIIDAEFRNQKLIIKEKERVAKAEARAQMQALTDRITLMKMERKAEQDKLKKIKTIQDADLDVLRKTQEIERTQLQAEQNRASEQIALIQQQEGMAQKQFELQESQRKFAQQEREIDLANLKKRVEAVNKFAQAVGESKFTTAIEEFLRGIGQGGRANIIKETKNIKGVSTDFSELDKLVKEADSIKKKMNEDRRKNAEAELASRKRILEAEKINNDTLLTLITQRQGLEIKAARLTDKNTKAEIQNKIKLIDTQIRTAGTEFKLIIQNRETRLSALGDELEKAKDAKQSRLNALDRERDVLRKIGNELSEKFGSRLEGSFNDLFNAIEQGTLTMSNFKEGVKNLFVGLLRDIGDTVFKNFVMDPIKEEIKGFFGGIFGEEDPQKKLASTVVGNAQRVTIVDGVNSKNPLDPGGTGETASQALLDAEKHFEAAQKNSAAVTKASEDLNIFGRAAANGGAAVSEAGSQISLGFQQITQEGGSFIDGLMNIFSGAFKGIMGLAQNILGKIGSAVFGGGGAGDSGGIFGSIFGKIFGGGGAADAASSSIGGAVGDFPTLGGSTMFTASGGLIGRLGGARGVRHFAAGGMQRDRVPALLEPGEFVMRKHAVNNAGVPAMQRMNAHGMPGQKVSINVVNEGSPKEGEQGGVDITPEQIVVDVILRDLKNNGAIRRGIREQT